MTSLSVPIAKVQNALFNAADALKHNESCEVVLAKIAPVLREEQHIAVLSILQDNLTTTNSPFLLKQLMALDGTEETENRIRARALENLSVLLVEKPELPQEILGASAAFFNLKDIGKYLTTSKSAKEDVTAGLQAATTIDIADLIKLKKSGINLGDAFRSLRTITRNERTENSLSRNDLIAIIRANPDLEELDLEGMPGDSWDHQVNDEVLIAIGQNCSKLRKLTLPNNFNTITDRGFIALAEGCHALLVLDFKGSSKVTQAGLMALADHCHLTHVCFSAHLDDAHIARYIERSPQLVSVYISGNNGNPVLTALGTFCPNLRSVDVSMNRNITDEGVRNLTRGCRQLTFLNISRCDLTDVSLREIANNCTQMRHLMLNELQEITDDGMVNVAEHCQELLILEMQNCNLVSNITLNAIAEHCKRLREIDLFMNGRAQIHINDEGLGEILRGCPDLAKLSISTFTRHWERVLPILAEERPDLQSERGFCSMTFKKRA